MWGRPLLYERLTWPEVRRAVPDAELTLLGYGAQPPSGDPSAGIRVLAPDTIDPRGQVMKQPLGRALRARKRSESPRQIFLGIHLDTVYPPDQPFQEVTAIDANTLRGPGVIDAKGGLVVMLTALEGLERICG